MNYITSTVLLQWEEMEFLRWKLELIPLSLLKQSSASPFLNKASLHQYWYN